jgi:hypothetical protein
MYTFSKKIIYFAENRESSKKVRFSQNAGGIFPKCGHFVKYVKNVGIFPRGPEIFAGAGNFPGAGNFRGGRNFPRGLKNSGNSGAVPRCVTECRNNVYLPKYARNLRVIVTEITHFSRSGEIPGVSENSRRARGGPVGGKSSTSRGKMSKNFGKFRPKMTNFRENSRKFKIFPGTKIPKLPKIPKFGKFRGDKIPRNSEIFKTDLHLTFVIFRVFLKFSGSPRARRFDEIVGGEQIEHVAWENEQKYREISSKSGHFSRKFREI